MELNEITSMTLRLIAAGLGLYLIISMVLAAVKTFILPRPADVGVVQAVFSSVRFLFDLRAKKAESYAERDRLMALYAPTALFIVPIVLLAVLLIGYMCLFWALGGFSMGEAFRLSGSSVLTLGNFTSDRISVKLLEFTAALLGLILVALLIAYLPTIYTAFTRRETQVELLEVRAGSPPSPWEMISRSYRTGELGQMREVWSEWQRWFAEIEESHTSLPALTFFRSPRPDLSWITAAGVVLDTAALMLSMVNVAMEPRAAFCIRSGYLALRQIASVFKIPYDPDPAPGDPIAISREEFDEVYRELAAQNIPLRPDIDQAWRDFAGWRVNYDAVLISLAALTMAPYAPWSSDRSRLPVDRVRRKIPGLAAP
jgi:hypothetical protein